MSFHFYGNNISERGALGRDTSTSPPVRTWDEGLFRGWAGPAPPFQVFTVAALLPNKRCRAATSGVGEARDLGKGTGPTRPSLTQALV